MGIALLIACRDLRQSDHRLVWMRAQEDSMTSVIKPYRAWKFYIKGNLTFFFYALQIYTNLYSTFVRVCNSVKGISTGAVLSKAIVASTIACVHFTYIICLLPATQRECIASKAISI